MRFTIEGPANLPGFDRDHETKPPGLPPVDGLELWSPTPSSAEMLYYVFGRGLRAEYESGSGRNSAWTVPSRVWFVPFDRLSEIGIKAP